MATTTQVKNLQWYIQGKTFTTDMIVLDTLPYDAILGYDWMKRNSPMTCDWQAKTMQFVHQGRQVTLQGITDPSPQPHSISAKQLYKSTKGNDIWAYVMLDTIHPVKAASSKDIDHNQEVLQDLLTLYVDVFHDPK